MPQDKPSLILTAAPWFGGAIVGALLAIFLVKTPASPEAEGLGVSISNLASAIGRLEANGGQANPLPQSDFSVLERTPLESPSLEELILRLASLESTLVTLAASIEESGSFAAVGNEFSDSVVSENYPMDVPALINLKGQSEVDVTIGSLGWSYNQILQKFGSPSWVSSSDNRVRFEYEDLPYEGSVSIVFQDGHVVAFYDSWDD